MVCIEKRPYTLYGRLATLHFRYLTCLLDRGHIRDYSILYPVFLCCQHTDCKLHCDNIQNVKIITYHNEN